VAKAKLKTTETKASVSAFLSNVENEKRRKDGKIVLKMFKDITGEKPKMWGPSIIGFGKHQYKYESGREGVICKVGFSPRKSSLVFYTKVDSDKYKTLMGKLGKYKIGKSCLYINKLEDIDEKILRMLIKESWDYMTKTYG